MPEALINVNGDNIQALQILFLTTAITLLPSLLVMMTSFTRYIVSFSFLRTAMGTQQTPPNIVLIGMALFLTLFTMNPALTEIRTQAYDPYVAGEIGQAEFIERAQVPLKDFMVNQTEPASINTFCDLGDVARPTTAAEARALPLQIIVPAFMTSELKRAFEIGFLLYIPFVLIDIVVSCTLMSMGMIMLPPAMISTPFKLLLFIVLDGWSMLFSTLVHGFR